MKRFFALFSVLFLISCSDKAKTENMGWHGSMQGLASSLTEIMPNLVTTSWVDEKQQKRELQKTLKQLSEYSESLDPSKMGAPTSDPSIEFLAADFNQQLQKLRKQARTKSPEDLKPEVRNLARYCVACHTRTQAGSSYFTASMDRKMKGFDHFEKATYLTSLRQYEKAMVNYEKALTDKKWAQTHPKKWREGTMNLLAISVRVKNDANLTLELISQLFDKGAVPKDLKAAARAWQQDAKAWNKEKQAKPGLKKVRELLDQAAKRDRKVANSGLLLNVRASAALNEYLRSGGMKAYREQGFLYYSGVISERLKKLNFSEFPESYYKACVEVDPKGSFTKRCQKRLQNTNVASL